MPPKVALVHDWLTTFAGGEQVLLALHEMYPEAPIYTSIWNPDKVTIPGAKIITSYLQNIPGAKTHHQLLIPLMPQAFESFDLKEFDIIISSSTGLAKGVITQPNQTHICYCHTPPRYLWRLGGDNRNDNRSDSWLRNHVAHSMRIWDVVSSERVDHFIANSQTVADRITKLWHRDATVIYPPVDTGKFSSQPVVQGNYFLSVSRLVEYKRLDIVIAACKKLGLALKVVGDGPEREALMKIANGDPTIEFLGRVADSELAAIYAGAKAFLFAGEEDFGIVPVEAMSAGKPVIAYAKGGLTESVVAEKTGLFFTEQTVESLIKVLQNFNSEMFSPEIIREHAKGFDVSIFKQKIQQFVNRHTNAEVEKA
jgi:glycosyltransferase involved in cell wall biosynthesis